MRVKKYYFIDTAACCYCGKKFNLLSKTTIEHIIPLIRGGYDGSPNVASCCRICNTAKGSMLPSEYLCVIKRFYEYKVSYKWVPINVMPNIISNLENKFVPKENDITYFNKIA